MSRTIRGTCHGLVGLSCSLRTSVALRKVSGSITDVSTEMAPLYPFLLRAPAMNFILSSIKHVLFVTFILGHNLRRRTFIGPRAWDGLRLDLSTCVLGQFRNVNPDCESIPRSALL
jgi:hypothetical protein